MPTGGAGVDNFTIQSGLETICTFTDTQLAPELNVVKSSTTSSITTAGQVVPYTFTVTNDGQPDADGCHGRRSELHLGDHRPDR